jgi:hypothetical protein
MSNIYYNGPGKVILGGTALFPEGDSGQVTLKIEEKTSVLSAALVGYVGRVYEEPLGEITVTPFNSWGLMATLYPFKAITVGGTPGAIGIGQNPFSTKQAAQVWTADGRLYKMVNGYITKPPSLFLGVSKPLFGSCGIACLGDPTLNPGTAGYLMDPTNPVMGPVDGGTVAVADPAAYAVADYISGHWTGVYSATISGGIASSDVLEVDDAWEVSMACKFNMVQCQKVTRAAWFASLEVMVKGKLVGPSHTKLIKSTILNHAMGQVMQEATPVTLVLSGPGSKSVTLNNCELTTQGGFSFGGATVNAGETAFYGAIAISGGAVGPLLAIV